MTDKNTLTVQLNTSEVANLIADRVTLEMKNAYLELLAVYDTENQPPITHDIDKLVDSLCEIVITACASTASLLGHENVAEKIRKAAGSD